MLFTAYNYRQEIPTFLEHNPVAFLNKIKQAWKPYYSLINTTK